MKETVSQGITILRDDGPIEFSKKASSYISRNLARSLVRPVYNNIWYARFGSGTSILEKDWDNLLLLDACRYDEFCIVSPYDNESINKRITLESRTPDFLRSTFNNGPYHDIVYVTANPQTLKYQYESNSGKLFHDTISLLDEWDEETQTIKPDVVREAAIEAANKYPDKKLLVHFLQPHAPFLGPTAESIRQRTGKTIGGLNPGREYTDMDSKNIETASYREILNQGIKRDEIRTAYRETLELVIDECTELRKILSGKTAITSDHGELLGERLFGFGPRQWEHPGNVRNDELCIVPYISFGYDSRKEIKIEPPVEEQSVNKDVVDKRLQSLGYK